METPPDCTANTDTAEVYDKASLVNIAEALDKLECSLQAYPHISADMKQPFAFARRAIRQFQALDTMIIVTCGMLKAGKSTLINLLARSDMASPVDFGVDTTLRPAVVRMGETAQGRIRCFYAHGDAQEYDRTLLQVFDVLRGVPLERRAAFDEETEPLTPQNLKDFLCGKVPSDRMKREPLLVVVETPHQDATDCLLQGNCMLLDMPGLDSANAEVSAKITHYADVVVECDMMFYVQSSVSPLNSKAEELLKQVLAHRHADTTYIIQNCMMAQMWRLPELQQKAQERQARRAAEKIVKCFKAGGVQVPGGGLRHHPMNLGMAYDALVGDTSVLNTAGVMPDGRPISAELLSELSGFPGFEDDVRHNMRRHGLRYRVQHCVDELDKRLDELGNRLSSYCSQQLRPELAKTEKEWKEWTGVKSEMENLRDNTPLPQHSYVVQFNTNAKRALENELNEVHKLLWDTKSDYEPLKNTGNKVNGSIIDAFLTDCAKDMATKLTEWVNKCSLSDVEVEWQNQSQSLCECVNSLLKSQVFEQCTPNKKLAQPTLPIYQDIQARFPVEYAFSHAKKLSAEYRESRFAQRVPSSLNGKGYPFTRYRFFNRIWEYETQVTLAHMVCKEMVKEYVDDAVQYLVAHGAELLKTLFENGKHRGMSKSLEFISQREKEILNERSAGKAELEQLETMMSELKTLKSKVKEIY